MKGLKLFIASFLVVFVFLVLSTYFPKALKGSTEYVIFLCIIVLVPLLSLLGLILGFRDRSGLRKIAGLFGNGFIILFYAVAGISQWWQWNNLIEVSNKFNSTDASTLEEILIPLDAETIWVDLMENDSPYVSVKVHNYMFQFSELEPDNEELWSVGNNIKKQLSKKYDFERIEFSFYREGQFQFSYTVCVKNCE